MIFISVGQNIISPNLEHKNRCFVINSVFFSLHFRIKKETNEMDLKNSSEEAPLVVKAGSKKRVIKGARKVIGNRIPQELLDDPVLKNDMLVLPQNYNFEVPKTIWRIKSLGCKRVALQLPEGLTMFATTLADIIEKHTGAEAVIMADVTYGACCVDDFSARALGCELMVHYGHSCLIPIDQTSGIKMLYVFVDIKMDPAHFIDTIHLNFVQGVLQSLTSFYRPNLILLLFKQISQYCHGSAWSVPFSLQLRYKWWPQNWKKSLICRLKYHKLNPCHLVKYLDVLLRQTLKTLTCSFIWVTVDSIWSPP